MPDLFADLFDLEFARVFLGGLGILLPLWSENYLWFDVLSFGGRFHHTFAEDITIERLALLAPDNC
jgi:hypothetical protein